ncbi:MAG: hypothetical protein ACLQLC_19155 [Candidatus Sulfotelmatobacter sp.]
MMIATVIIVVSVSSVSAILYQAVTGTENGSTGQLLAGMWNDCMGASLVFF